MKKLIELAGKTAQYMIWINAAVAVLSFIVIGVSKSTNIAFLLFYLIELFVLGIVILLDIVAAFQKIELAKRKIALFIAALILFLVVFIPSATLLEEQAVAIPFLHASIYSFLYRKACLLQLEKPFPKKQKSNPEILDDGFLGG